MNKNELYGAPLAPHYDELTPLEQAIARFEEKAKAYYRCSRTAPIDETAEQRAAGEKVSREALQHWSAKLAAPERERRHAMIRYRFKTVLKGRERYRATSDE